MAVDFASLVNKSDFPDIPSREAGANGVPPGLGGTKLSAELNTRPKDGPVAQTERF